MTNSSVQTPLERAIANLQVLTYKVPYVTAQSLNDDYQTGSAGWNVLKKKVKALKHLKIDESAIVSTCNRDQYIWTADSPQYEPVVEAIAPLTNGRARIDFDKGFAQQETGQDALEYLMRSAIGAHSKVTFDAGIFDQFTKSLHFALMKQASGTFIKVLTAMLDEYRNLPTIQPLIAPSEGQQIAYELENYYANHPSDKQIEITLVGTGAVAEDVVHALASSKVEGLRNAAIHVGSRSAERMADFTKEHQRPMGFVYRDDKPLTAEQIQGDVVIITNASNKIPILDNQSLQQDARYTVYDVTTGAQLNIGERLVDITRLPALQERLRENPKVLEMRRKMRMHEPNSVLHELTRNYVELTKSEAKSLVAANPELEGGALLEKLAANIKARVRPAPSVPHQEAEKPPERTP